MDYLERALRRDLLPTEYTLFFRGFPDAGTQGKVCILFPRPDVQIVTTPDGSTTPRAFVRDADGVYQRPAGFDFRMVAGNGEAVVDLADYSAYTRAESGDYPDVFKITFVAGLEEYAAWPADIQRAYKTILFQFVNSPGGLGCEDSAEIVPGLSRIISSRARHAPADLENVVVWVA